MGKLPTGLSGCQVRTDRLDRVLTVSGEVEGDRVSLQKSTRV